MRIVVHVKCPVLLSDFNETWNFLYRFSKNTETRKFMKIRPVGAELLHADGQTDITKLTVDFGNFRTRLRREAGDVVRKITFIVTDQSHFSASIC